jgi:hypothetical protein
MMITKIAEYKFMGSSYECQWMWISVDFGVHVIIMANLCSYNMQSLWLSLSNFWNNGNHLL